MKKIIFLLIILSFVTRLTAQVTNDDCVNSTPITLDATGNACITSTTLNALTTSFDTHPCWPTLQDIPDVWFSYVATGADNVITVTPTGGTPAQQLAVTITDGVVALAHWMVAMLLIVMELPQQFRGLTK